MKRAIKGTGEKTRSLIIYLSDTLNKICEVTLFILLSAMIVVTTLQVIFRYFFEALSWSEEVVRYMLIWVSMIGAAIAFKKGNHIAVTLLLNKLKGKAFLITQVAIILIEITFFIIVSYYGYTLISDESSQLTPSLQIPISVIYTIYPIIGITIIVHLLAQLQITFTKQIKNGGIN